MELISKNYLCQLCGENSTNDIKWKKVYLPSEVDQHISTTLQNLLLNIEIPLLDDNSAVIYIPSVSLVLLPELYSTITTDQIIEKLLKTSIELNCWNLEYLGNDNFPTFRHNEFVFSSSKVISNDYRDLKNLQSGRYRLSSPGYNEVFELLIDRENDISTWRWINVNISSDIMSNIKSRYSDRLFSSCVFQLCIFRDYK